MLLFIASFLLTIVAALIQTTNWMLFDSILKPNLILVVLIILALVNPSWSRRAILILAAALILKFTPGINFSDLAFLGAVFSSIVLMDILPWQQPISSLLAILFGTIIINLDELTLLPLILEVVLNLFFALILLALPRFVHVPQIKLQRNRF